MSALCNPANSWPSLAPATEALVKTWSSLLGERFAGHLLYARSSARPPGHLIPEDSHCQGQAHQPQTQQALFHLTVCPVGLQTPSVREGADPTAGTSPAGRAQMRTVQSIADAVGRCFGGSESDRPDGDQKQRPRCLHSATPTVCQSKPSYLTALCPGCPPGPGLPHPAALSMEPPNSAEAASSHSRPSSPCQPGLRASSWPCKTLLAVSPSRHLLAQGNNCSHAHFWQNC